MRTTNARGPERRPRRRPLAMSTASILAVALLAGCGSAGAGTGGPEEGDGTLPNYVPLTFAEPDVPGINGAPDGYTQLPEEFERQFPEAPGAGGTYTAMTPLWGAVPKTDGNQYLESVNEAMGTTIDFQITDGTTYGDKLAAVLADQSNIPDWVSIPTWNFPPRFGQAVGTLFEDLTPFLAGDAVEAYPNLANIPTDAWRSCSWNGKVYGIPFPAAAGQRNAAFYRSDLLPDAELPTTAEEMLEFVEENHADGHWGSNDLWIFATAMFGVPSKWTVVDGELVHRVETQEYRDALQWMADLYATGAVHPDAVADNAADGKQRFESGEVVITADGVGAWHEALSKMRPADPEWDMAALPYFAAEGGDPVLYKSDAASMCSYLKATDDDAQIEELLDAANFLAAPFGTEENMLITNGVEGVHYELDQNNAPVKTDLGRTEVQPTFMFLVAPPEIVADPEKPDYVEARVKWQNETTLHEVEEPFYGMRVTEPNQFASLDQPFADLEKDIARGRKDMEDLDSAIETWRTSGGEELRNLYQEILDGEAAEIADESAEVDE